MIMEGIMILVKSTLALVQLLHVDLLRAAVDARVGFPPLLLRVVPALVVLLQVRVARPRLHLPQQHHLPVVHVLGLVLVDGALGAQVGVRPHLAAEAARHLGALVLLVDGEVARELGLEVHLDLLQVLPVGGAHFPEFAAHGGAFLALGRLEGGVLLVGFLREDEVAGEVLQVLGDWLADEVVPVAGVELVVLGDVLVLVLRLPLPVDRERVVGRVLLLHELVVGELRLPRHRQRALLLPLVDVPRQRLLVPPLPLVVRVQPGYPELLGLSLRRHLVRLWLVVHCARQVAREVVGQFLLVDLRRGWAGWLFVGVVVVGERFFVVVGVVVVVPGDFLDGAGEVAAGVVAVVGARLAVVGVADASGLGLALVGVF